MIEQAKLKVLEGATKSRTMWFNVLSAVFVAAEPAMQLLQPVLGESTYGVVTFVVIIGNVLLRAITTKALGDK